MRVMIGPNRKPRVLLVDDEPDITSVFRRAFESQGYEVDTFIDPNKAANHFKPGYYDVCILDIRMPEKTGFELARDIWRLDDQTQVCFLSAFEVYGDEAKRIFKSFKTHCFIKKPIAPSALIIHVEKHFIKTSSTSPP